MSTQLVLTLSFQLYPYITIFASGQNQKSSIQTDFYPKKSRKDTAVLTFLSAMVPEIALVCICFYEVWFLKSIAGWKYGMMSMKVYLTMLIQKFHVKTLEPKPMDEIQLEYMVVSRPKNVRLVFEKRK